MIPGTTERYIFRAVLPYFLFALFFLTAILLFQQVNRLSSIYPAALLTTSNVFAVVNALIPKTLAFTLPMSVLIGVVLGISKLRAESEITAIQSAGISTARLFHPLFIFSLFICSLCCMVNLYVSPLSLSHVRQRLKTVSNAEITSAISVGAFSTEIPKMSIYIREGNSDLGEWKGLFISKDEGDFERVITAASGSIDFDGSKVELVLRDVTSIRYPQGISLREHKSLVTERLRFLRIEVADNLAAKKASLEDEDRLVYEEMTNSEMLTRAREGGSNSTESYIQFQRRLALSLSPLVLALVGFQCGLSFNRSSKTFGLILSLALLIAYYIVFLTGEQLTRTGSLPVYVGGWLANVSFIAFLFLTAHAPKVARVPRRQRRHEENKVTQSREVIAASSGSPEKDAVEKEERKAAAGRHIGPRLLAGNLLGYLDICIIRKTILFFMLSYLTIISVFMVFTFFDIWKSIFTNKIPFAIVLKYFFFLLPLVTVQVIGPCTLIATFVTFLLMAGRNEVVVWLSSGTSVYRQMFTSLIIGCCLAAVHWTVQEYAMPRSNKIQDSLRSHIKSGYPKALVSSGRQWLATDRAIFNYEFDSIKSTLKTPRVYSLDATGQLSSILLAAEAKWDKSLGMVLIDNLQIKVFEGQSLYFSPETNLGVSLSPNYFSTFLSKPFYLTIAELREQIDVTRGRGEEATQLEVALYRRYSEPFVSIISVVIGACIALLFRKGKLFLQIIVMIASGIGVLMTVQFSVGLGVLLGLPILLSCLLPYLLLNAVGVYLVALVRT
jgi:LPS export ABC transporter permease LptF